MKEQFEFVSNFFKATAGLVREVRSVGGLKALALITVFLMVFLAGIQGYREEAPYLMQLSAAILVAVMMSFLVPRFVPPELSGRFSVERRLRTAQKMSSVSSASTA